MARAQGLEGRKSHAMGVCGGMGQGGGGGCGANEGCQRGEEGAGQ